jgi:hypothetical protein
MNTIADFLTRIPITSLSIKTSIKTYAVLERIKNAIDQQETMDKQEKGYFYVVDIEDNYFLLQTAYVKKYESNVLIPENRISFGNAYNLLSMDPVPIFFGKVLDSEYGDGAIINGHFGIPAPIYLALAVPVLILLTFGFPNVVSCSLPLAGLFLFRSLISVYQFINERKGIKTYLNELFKDVIFEDNQYM